MFYLIYLNQAKCLVDMNKKIVTNSNVPYGSKHRTKSSVLELFI